MVFVMIGWDRITQLGFSNLQAREVLLGKQIRKL